MKRFLIVICLASLNGCVGYLGASSYDTTVTAQGKTVTSTHVDESATGVHSSQKTEMYPLCNQCKLDNPAHPEMCAQSCGYTAGGYYSPMGGMTPGGAMYGATAPMTYAAPYGGAAVSGGGCGPSGCVSRDELRENNKHVVGAIEALDCKITNSCSK